mmetsp:Transcript_11402/g.28076  ORF Transcript_11402/g.28076 Transcript_11402/m.28076 type:complete len:163 (-) Transcript_11402:52-540(-)
MPFVLVRYDNKYRFFTIEAPVELVRKLAKKFRKINFKIKMEDETRVTGEMAQTGASLRNILDAIEANGWTLAQASTGGHTSGKMGNELYVFSQPPSRHKGEEKTSSGGTVAPLMLPPPPKTSKKSGENYNTSSSSHNRDRISPDTNAEEDIEICPGSKRLRN